MSCAELHVYILNSETIFEAIFPHNYFNEDEILLKYFLQPKDL